MMNRSPLHFFFLLLLADGPASSFTCFLTDAIQTRRSNGISRQRTASPLFSSSSPMIPPTPALLENTPTTTSTSFPHKSAAFLAGAFLCGVLSFQQPVLAASTDYASDTVKTAITQLQQANGNAEATVKVYESIAEIITEGKGVGGAINYQGIQLDRGYVADEDTTLYNPGLTLLTESEKNQLVSAIVQSKEETISAWNVDTDAGYQFLVEKLDPLHMYELKGYLSIVPFYAAAVYLAVLAVQQLARDFFPAAYIVGVVAVFGPMIALVALGPT